MKYHLYISLVLFCLFSCNSKNDKYQALDSIEDIIQIYPDSALHLLDSLNILGYNIFDQNKVFLFRVQAMDLTNKDISMENDILDVYYYFKEVGSDKLIGFASFYAARVLHENREYAEAMNYYKTTEDYARKKGDTYLQGYSLFWMAMLMLDQYMFEEAKQKLEEAKLIFVRTNNRIYEIKLYKNVGNSYLSSEPDSSLLYYNKALDLAHEYNNKKEQAQITQNMGIALSEKRDHRSAVQALLSAIRIDSTAHKSGKVFLNLAQSYLDINMPDSARYYVNIGLAIAQNNNDSKLEAFLYEVLSGIEENCGNYNTALENYKLHSTSLGKILSENKNKAILNAESKYNFKAMQNENNKLSLKQLKTQRVLTLTLLFIALITIIYLRLILRKNKQLSKANDEIVNLTDTIKELDINLKELDITKESYIDNLIHNYNILKRAASLEYFVQDTGNKQGKSLIRSFNVIAYGNEIIVWDVIYKIINTINGELFDKLKDKYPDLDENEYRICCLIYSKFNSNEIAVITQLSINTVHVKTTTIRKKLGIEKYGNIVDFINDKFN